MTQVELDAIVSELKAQRDAAADRATAYVQQIAKLSVELATAKEELAKYEAKEDEQKEAA